MTFVARCACVMALLLHTLVGPAQATAPSWAQAVQVENLASFGSISITAVYSKGGMIDFSLRNSADADLAIQIPPGLQCQDSAGAKVVILARAKAAVPPRSSISLSVPAAALGSGSTPSGALTPLSGSDQRLEPFLGYLAQQKDFPRETSQLIVWALTEDISFSQWEQAPRGEADATRDVSRETAQAVDALGVLRTLYPDKAFALAADSGLKLRALRSPATRQKALQVFGLSIPGDAVPGQVPPDLGQLLHTKQGDNCPICKMRQRAQPPEGL